MRRSPFRVDEALIGVAAATTLALVAPGAFAATINVTSFQDVVSDDGVCTLREAIIAANEDFPSGVTGGECPAGNGADKVVLTNAGTYSLLILGEDDNANAGDFDISEDLEIDGINASNRTVNANGIDRHFYVLPGVTVTIRDVTLTGGVPSDFPEDGGAIYNDGTLHVLDSVISGNQAEDEGGGIHSEFGEILQVTRTTFRNNHTTGCCGEGGGIETEGPTTIVDCVFDGNSADRGGAVFLDGDADGSSIVNTNFIGNSAADSGGAVYNDFVDPVTIADSSFVLNTAVDDGGALYLEDQTTIRNSTFSDNDAGDLGGAVYASAPDGSIFQNVTFNEGSEASSAIHVDSLTELTNTIISGRCGGDPPVSNGGNIEGPGNTCSLSGIGDVTGASSAQINLLPLALNGGTTFNHLPGPGSLALEGGSNTGCQVTDQRGVARPQDFDGAGGATCDRGAIELKPCNHSDIVTVSNTTVVGDSSEIACEEIRLGSNLVIDSTADASYLAGQKVVIRSGTSIESGATVSISARWASWETVP